MSDIVYKVPGNHFGPEGSTYDYVAVHSKTEFSQKIKEGWFNTLVEAVKASKVRARDEEGQYVADDPETPEDEAYTDAPPTRKELEAKAKELGITFRNNIGDKKLLEKIEAKIG